MIKKKSTRERSNNNNHYNLLIITNKNICIVGLHFPVLTLFLARSTCIDAAADCTNQNINLDDQLMRSGKPAVFATLL